MSKPTDSKDKSSQQRKLGSAKEGVGGAAGKSKPTLDRSERLSEALRANLKKRKSQARLRKASQVDEESSATE